MRLRRIFLAFVVVLLAGALLSVTMIGSQKEEDVDIVAINEAVKTVESEWENIAHGNTGRGIIEHGATESGATERGSTEYGATEHGSIVHGIYSAIRQPFTIMDNSGDVIYQSRAGMPESIYAAIRNRDIIVDVRQSEQIVGKLIIHNEHNDLSGQMQKRLAAIIFATFSCLALLCVVYLLYIYWVLVKPFRKLQSFALHVARGNLNIPLEMDRSNLFGAFTESFDIMREELAAARQGEYESNRSKKELVASLSHDIKTPVASIKAVSELMLMRATDEKAIKQLNTIYSKAEQINLLVTDMFHATLEELQELKVTVTEESSEVLAGMIATSNYDNQIRCGPIPECIILTDTTRMQQVLDNILSNSFKYAATAIDISFSLNGNYLELCIMDYGKGVDEEKLPLLFNKFYRGDNVGDQSGSGLGLYISQYFMHNMQGDIECYNWDDGFSVVLRIKLA